MAINGPITTFEFKQQAGAIRRRFGVIAYAHCWFDLMILHRHTAYLESVFACLGAEQPG